MVVYLTYNINKTNKINTFYPLIFILFTLNFYFHSRKKKFNIIIVQNEIGMKMYVKL